jgi:transcription initiation factor TFIID TATA-box-binding protein
MESPRLVILVFVSGRIVVTGGKARSAIVEAVQKLYPVLLKYRKQLPAAPASKRSKAAPTSTSIVVTGSGVETS